MSGTTQIESHWARGDVYALIVSALQQAGKSPDSLTVEDLAPVDHFHARGFPATVDLADHLPIKSTDHVLDIGCGIGGPARYFAKRFGCRVSGVDITGPFIDAANKLTALLGMTGQVSVEQGDALSLSYRGETFDGAYSQHVTMNIPDRAQFFAEAFRVLKPGAFFGLTEHGLGPVGDPYHPLPWSEDGTGEWLATPEETVERLSGAGFVDIDVQHSGPKYIAAYGQMIAAAERGELPTLGIHILLGDNALQKARNSKRSIEEGRTHPIQVICRKPS
jgi:SAM-dependent methyltransferase